LIAKVITYCQKGACDSETYLIVVTSELVTTFCLRRSSWLGEC